MSIEVTPFDVLEKIRQSQGEDELSGYVPVEVVRFDLEVDLTQREAPTQMELTQLQGAQARSRVGRIPCEALYWILVSKVGKTWWHLEWEVLIEELAKDGYYFDGAGHAKVMALWSVLRAPLHDNPFYRNWQAFLFLVCSLMGRPVKWGELAVPTPVEIALAAHICLEVRPHGFSPEVLGTIASCCIYHGLWCLPDILQTAQVTVLEQLAYHSIPLTTRDVSEVTERIISLIKQGKTSDDALDPDEDGIKDEEEILRIQVIRVLDFQERLNTLYDRGERAKDLVIETLVDSAPGKST